MSRSWKGAIAAALCCLAAACGSGEEEAATPEAPEAPALVLQLQEVPRWTPVAAQVATEDQAQAVARIPGILTSLSVTEGDYVKKGQAIGRIVDSQLGYQSGAYGAQAAAAQAQAAQAQAELARIKYLYDNGVYAQARLDQAQAAASAAQAQVRAAQEQQRAVNAVAGQGAVLAPATGRVLGAEVPAGSAVAPGTVIATITAGPLLLRMDVPESLAREIHPGSAVVVEGLGPDGATVRGSIVRVYPAVAGGQVRADATVPGLDGSLIGRRVTARVEAGRREALLVPERYVATRFGTDFVTVLTKDGRQASVPVQTASSEGEGKVEILSGVSAGDRLVAGADQ